MYLGGYKQYPFQLNEYKLSLSLHIIINVAEEYNPNRRRRSGAITMLTLSLSRPPDPLFLTSLICAKPWDGDETFNVNHIIIIAITFTVVL